MEKKIDFAITFACFNQIEYTKMCIHSLEKTGIDLARVVAVDNGSTDGTREYLQSLPLGGVILNKVNLGCGAAWNQGSLFLQAEWTVVMNNDIICAPGWLEGLIETAEREELKVISPGMIEGTLDYDLDTFSQTAKQKMSNALRPKPHAVCMAIHRSVWMDVGYFLPIPRLMGLEDTLFFNQLKAQKIKSASTGNAWIHHYGSVTQSAIKAEKRLCARSGLGDISLYHRLQGRSWLLRKLDRIMRKRLERAWKTREMRQFGMSLRGERVDGKTFWH